jgi:hypothetical protein
MINRCFRMYYIYINEFVYLIFFQIYMYSLTHTRKHKATSSKHTPFPLYAHDTYWRRSNVTWLVYRNSRVHACALQALELSFFTLFTDKMIGTKRNTALPAVSDVLLSVLCVFVSVSVSVLVAHMSGLSTGGFFMSCGRGEISGFVFGEIKGGSP